MLPTLEQRRKITHIFLIDKTIGLVFEGNSEKNIILSPYFMQF